MISKTKVVISNEISKLWSGGKPQPIWNKTPDTMKMDLGQNILEKSLLMFSEAKASWVYTRLAQKKMPKSSRMHTLTFKVASKLKKSLIIFIFIPLSSKPSSLYVSNSTFPSPQKKKQRIPLNHRTPELDKGWIHRWPFVLRCVHVS